MRGQRKERINEEADLPEGNTTRMEHTDFQTESCDANILS